MVGAHVGVQRHGAQSAPGKGVRGRRRGDHHVSAGPQSFVRGIRRDLVHSDQRVVRGQRRRERRHQLVHGGRRCGEHEPVHGAGGQIARRLLRQLSAGDQLARDRDEVATGRGHLQPVEPPVEQLDAQLRLQSSQHVRKTPAGRAASGDLVADGVPASSSAVIRLKHQCSLLKSKTMCAKTAPSATRQNPAGGAPGIRNDGAGIKPRATSCRNLRCATTIRFAGLRESSAPKMTFEDHYMGEQPTRRHVHWPARFYRTQGNIQACRVPHCCHCRS